MNIFVSQNDLAYQSNPSLTLVGTCCSKTVLQYFLASPSLHLIIRWIYKFSDRSIRDQCTYTRTNLQYIIPHFWCICTQRVLLLRYLYKWFNFDNFWQIACFMSINPTFCHCYKKHLKWGDEVIKRVSPIVWSWSSLEKEESLAC